MVYQTLKYEKKENVGIINIVLPATGQVVMDQLADELSDLCAEIGWDGDTRVVVLAGMGSNSFSMEDDLRPIPEGDVELETKFRSLAEPIAGVDRPVIAAINGDAIGRGLELALACDLRIATEGSFFAFPHIKAGLIPWDGGTQRLSRLVGRSKAIEMILTGERIDSKEAYRIGLVNHVVRSDELITVAITLAKEMASKGPIALRYAKEAIGKGMDLTLEQGLRLETDLYLLLHTTKDRTEGINAFRAKKPPKFGGK
jgi:enoyl-CoA hydratase/carnithine racemase